MNTLVPIPHADVSVREATLDDVAFIDQLQKMHDEQVGFMRTSWIEAKIAKGEVIVAEDAGLPVGYCMGVDRYFKRDDVGIIYQLNVVPGKQRAFVGATLLKAMFDRSAYGCRLFCCWCAQDIKANYFWEAMGFVPLAFRAGSEKKARVHIFWQKRIREGDCATPWWFPAKTDAGAMREDRVVLPIPPGKHWSDEMPVMRPAQAALPDTTDKTRATLIPGTKCGPLTPTPSPRAKASFGAPTTKAVVVEEAKPVKTKMKREKKKADPRLIAAARELRDRWLEHVNSGQLALDGAGKYDATRALPARISPAPLLPSPPALLPLLPAA